MARRAASAAPPTCRARRTPPGWRAPTAHATHHAGDPVEQLLALGSVSSFESRTPLTRRVLGQDRRADHQRPGPRAAADLVDADDDVVALVPQLPLDDRRVGVGRPRTVIDGDATAGPVAERRLSIVADPPPSVGRPSVRRQRRDRRRRAARRTSAGRSTAPPGRRRRSSRGGRRRSRGCADRRRCARRVGRRCGGARVGDEPDVSTTSRTPLRSATSQPWPASP